MCEDVGHHLYGVVEGDEVVDEAVYGLGLEHGQQSCQHHHQHEGGDHGAGVLHVFGQGGEQADGGGHDQHRGEDDQKQSDIVACGVVEGYVDALVSGRYHVGQREGNADETADAAKQGDAAEGDNLAEGQFVAAHGGDEEGGDGATLLLAGDAAGGNGHHATEEHHDDEHGQEFAEDVAHHLVVAGLVEGLAFLVGAVDVETVGHAVLR